MLYAQVHLTLPAWVHESVDASARHVSDADKVALAIELSRINMEAATGGPFGAVVFGPDDHIIAIGVNRVLPQNTSLAHAENMAYMLAQQRLQTARLNERVGGTVTLATSSQPCCQCYGATVWAGIDRLLIGARAEDVMELTEFDEGPLPADWVGEMNKRGIEVVRDLNRDAAREVLRAYGERGGDRY
ncbi:nucleoside deaminase [Pseudoxanthomonas gei]|uniref:Nucleoside deaminase n=1 Tax=Pseudoxanthomonas gei TaxID=1383030 RepID=A0ABX0AJH6_9GAMM|nr:nucleoside deaminase [Pseudoxanthomonas gei]NDK40245.1 nucleoside deaminase [Pseudoxanthomonas gei]